MNWRVQMTEMISVLGRLLIGWGGLCAYISLSLLFWTAVGIIACVDLNLIVKLFTATMIVFLLLFGYFARTIFRWGILDFLLSYAAVVITIHYLFFWYLHEGHLRRTADVCGPLFDSFCLQTGYWVLRIGAAWFTGFAIGSLILRRRERREACKVSSIGSDRGNT